MAISLPRQVWLVGAPILAAALAAQNLEAGFSDEIRPILADKCFRCHGPDEKSRAADLRLDGPQSATRDLGGYAAIVPFDAKGSELLRRIFATDADEIMPPPESTLTLTAAEKEALRRWIDSGARFERHWAFVPPRRLTPPSGAPTQHPIDAFIEAQLRSEGLGFSDEASAAQLVRRVTLDLSGLPPTIEQVDALTLS